MSSDPKPPGVDAVVFDMDGVLVESEAIWQQVREEFARDVGGQWRHEDQVATMGVNTAAWARIMVERLELRDRPGWSEARVAREVIARMQARYAAALPQRAGAAQAVRRIAGRCTLALASGSPRELGEVVLAGLGLGGVFAATVYGDEVEQGKPAPDIYLRALAMIGVSPGRAVGIEDSGNGVRSLLAAGMGVIAVPLPGFPLSPELAAQAGVRLASMEQLEFRHVELAAAARPGTP